MIGVSVGSDLIGFDSVGSGLIVPLNSDLIGVSGNDSGTLTGPAGDKEGKASSAGDGVLIGETEVAFSFPLSLLIDSCILSVSCRIFSVSCCI